MSAFTRKLAEGLYGGHQPGNVALAVALGVLTGALVGWNVSWLLPLLAAIALNVHTRFFLAALLSGLFSAWLARGWLHEAGRLLLDETPLGAAVGRLGDGIFPALAGWDQYLVVGGAAMSSIAALLAALAFSTLTVRLNRRWEAVLLSVVGGDGKPPERPRPVGAALACVWYGPTKCERSLRRGAKPRRLRRYGAAASLAASLALAAGAWSMAGSYAQRELWRQLSVYTGTEVAAEATDISLWTGRFTVYGLHVGGPHATRQNHLRVAVAKGVLSPGLLLRGKLNIEKLVLERIALGGNRRDAANDAASAAMGLRYERDAAARPGELSIQNELRHWPAIRRHLGTLERLVLAVEQLSRAEQVGRSNVEQQAVKSRSDLGIYRPRVFVQQLRMTDPTNAWRLGEKSLVELKSISSNPALCDRTAELKVIVPKFGAQIELAFDSVNAGKAHALRGSAYDVALAQLVDGDRARRTLSVRDGRARLSAQGVCDSRRIDLQVKIDLEALDADVMCNERLAGISVETWKDGLARLGSFRGELRLSGPWSAPNLIVDQAQLVDGFRRQLALAGAADVVAAVDGQLATNERQANETFVVQASANEAEVTEDRPGFFDVADDASSVPEAAPESASEFAPAEALETADAALDASYPRYPTTSPGEPSVEQPPPIPSSLPQMSAVRRPLPGPVNMAVGRDPSCAASVPFDRPAGFWASRSGPRENVFSRWSRGLRQKFSHSSAEPTPPEDEPAFPPAASPPPQRSPVSAAASETWYNRMLR